MFTEDKAAFLDRGDFAEDAVYNGGDTKPVIFDERYAGVDVDFPASESSQPRALGTTEDFPNVVHGHTLQIRGVIYKVVGVEPDGTGWVLMILQE